MSRFPSSRRRRGFTLIELMVVMLIMGILMAMLLAGISKAMAMANNTNCKSNLKGIGTAVSANHASLGFLKRPAAGSNIYVDVMNLNSQEDLKTLVCPATTITVGTNTSYQANAYLFQDRRTDAIMPDGGSLYVMIAENIGNFLLSDATPMYGSLTAAGYTTGVVVATPLPQLTAPFTPTGSTFSSAHTGVLNILRGDFGVAALFAGFQGGAAVPVP